MSKILLSIIIPSYNRADFLGQCLRSVLASTDQRIEIIVSDNCSPDHTEKVARSFEDPRYRYYRQEVNIGALRNFYFLTKESRGEYIFFLTDDDFMLTYVLKKVLDFIEKYKPAGFKCGLLVYQMLSNAAYLYSAFSKSFVADEQDFESQSTIFWNSHIATSTCFRKDVLDFEFYEQTISKLYPSMLFMGMA